MSSDKIDKYFNLTSILLFIGLACVVAGVYFHLNDLSSSGVTMGGYGEPYGTGTLNGKGIIFCGLMIAFFGWMLRDKPVDKQNKK